VSCSVTAKTRRAVKQDIRAAFAARLLLRHDYVSLRAFLLIGLLLAASSLATALGAEDEGGDALHVLNRLGYGPAPGDIERVRKVGTRNYIQAQLHPEQIPLPQRLRAQLDTLETLRLDAVELYKEYGPPPPQRGAKPNPEAVKAARERARVILQQAAHARLLRAIESPRQLEEVMVDFWFNHFNVFAAKGLDHLWTGAYEEQAIRPHAFGRFRDLLGATARHPAMLFYLDNWQNSAPKSAAGARDKRQGLNENYARELMELHTLGVNGGYTQDDVVALARIFTGWGLGGPRQRGSKGGFYFDSKRHDNGEKKFLGQTLRGAGQAEGERALDMLARHPATARHISFKLAQYFVADKPPPALVDRLARRFVETDGDIRAVLTQLYDSTEFWDPQYRGKKFKTPYHYAISAVRTAGVPIDNTRPLAGWLLQQGMPLYGCLTPNGYKNTEDAWLNPDAVTRRINLATALGSGRLPLAQSPEMSRARGDGRPGRSESTAAPLDWQALAQTLGQRLGPDTRAALEAAPSPLRAALILGSPEFMRR
jgi:uncharacterized protein (DUF1800 family)